MNQEFLITELNHISFLESMAYVSMGALMLICVMDMIAAVIDFIRQKVDSVD